jgi:hypothetical protein
MLARRACASVRSALPAAHAAPASSRSFAAGAVLHSSTRSPSLADITSTDAASFAKKQKEFRESLVAAQKQKDQEESASTPSTLSASASSASSAAEGSTVSAETPW